MLLRHFMFGSIPKNSSHLWYPNNYIEYYADSLTTPSEYDFGSNYISNTFDSGIGILEFDNSVTKFGVDCFWNTKITKIFIPETVESIDWSSLQACIDLEEIYVHPNNLIYDSRENCNAVILTATNTLTNGCKNSVIVNGILYIGTCAFRDCTTLDIINFPDTLLKIKDRAFFKCTGIENINIPDSCTSLGIACFNGCTSLLSIILSKNLTTIPEECFKNCSMLKEVTIPEKIQTIGVEAFYNTSISSINIPNKVTSLGIRAFYGNKYLTNVIFSNSITQLGYECFRNCSSLTEITLQEGVKTLGLWCFGNCKNVVNVSLPTSLTSIEGACFYGCSSVVLFKIPEGITVLKADDYGLSGMFEGCIALKRLDLPSTITKFGNFMCDGCTNLVNIYYNNTIEQWNTITKESNWKRSVNSGCVVHCTDGDIPIADA